MGGGIKHPLALMEGATENAALAQALIDNLIERGLDPAVPRLFIIDGSKALSAIRRWPRDGDPALPDSQGAQHHGAIAEGRSAARCARPGSSIDE
jgi:hypothetical protein